MVAVVSFVMLRSGVISSSGIDAIVQSKAFFYVVAALVAIAIGAVITNLLLWRWTGRD
jgi:hypothetical protein